MTGLATGPKTKIASAISNVLDKEVSKFVDGKGYLSLLLDIGISFIGTLAEWFFDAISFITALGKMIGSTIYTVLKFAAVTAIKVVLTPIIGPFAWLVAQIVDWGLDWVEWKVDVRGVCNDAGKWIANNTQSFIMSALKDIGSLF